jgi:DNA polymerase III epsilon subunit-like protein
MIGLQLMAKTFFERLAGRFDFPNNYTVIDIETSGLSPQKNLICSIGHTIVRDKKPIETGMSYLNWALELGVDQEQLIYDLNKVKEAMERKGKQLLHSYSVLKEHGKPPRVVLNEYLAMFEAMEERNEIMVTHNGWAFDVPFLENSISRWVLSTKNQRFEFNDELVYDTGAITKASQLPLDSLFSPLPAADESMKEFALRIAGYRAAGVYWSLDGYCATKFGLMEKAGVDASQAHAADVDTLLTYYLVEAQREMAYGHN